ncbi:MAG TPA: type II toxin-antitoxin system RelE/ParE family toxin [Steroidobacteraceae bacterium]|nr:type II toxin-antitoxin system RelE/ParE family toxin [Steroidobacteraceae bacterium]
MTEPGEGGPRKIPLVFYRSSAGVEPVLKWLKSLAADERKEIGQDLMRAQWRWPVGMPLCRFLGGGLWEIRSNLPGRTARVLFCIKDGSIVALHGFIKKTRKTPAADLKLAQKRMEEVIA